MKSHPHRTAPGHGLAGLVRQALGHWPAQKVGHWPVLALLAGCLGLAGAPAQAATSTAAGFVPGEVLLVLRSGDDFTALQQRHGFSLLGRFGARPIYRLRVAPGGDATALAGALAGEPGVVSADLNYRRADPEAVRNHVFAIGTAGTYSNQWAGTAIGLRQAQVGQPSASRLRPSSLRPPAIGLGVRVAVLDTGFDLGHPALAGHWTTGWDFVDGDADPSDTSLPGQGAHGHGTHVAGLVAWVAPGARIMPLRVLDTQGGGNAWVLAEALLYAVDPDRNPATPDGAQVINLSLAGLDRTRLMDTVGQLVGCGLPDVDTALVDLSDAGYNDDRQRCADLGGAVVAAGAGNDAHPTLRTYPAAEGSYGLLAVSASASNGRLAAFSNSGGWIHLAAPGEGITSSLPGGQYGTWSGTSMATPLVAGVAAMVRGRHPQLAARDVARCLVASGKALDGTRLLQLDAAGAMRRLDTDPRRCR